MTVRSHSTRRQFEVARWRLRTASSASISGDARTHGNAQWVHGCAGPSHLVGDDDDSVSSCRLFALPCAVLQQLLSLCDGRTVCATPSLALVAITRTRLQRWRGSWERSTAAASPSTARLTAHRARSSTPPCATQRSSNTVHGVHGCWCVPHDPACAFHPVADTRRLYPLYPLCPLCPLCALHTHAHDCTRRTRCTRRTLHSALDTCSARSATLLHLTLCVPC